MYKEARDSDTANGRSPDIEVTRVHSLLLFLLPGPPGPAGRAGPTQRSPGPAPGSPHDGNGRSTPGVGGYFSPRGLKMPKIIIKLS